MIVNGDMKIDEMGSITDQINKSLFTVFLLFLLPKTRERKNPKNGISVNQLLFCSQ